MDFDRKQQIVREQRAGYAALRQFEIEQMRSATFEDRLAAFCRVLSFSECLPNRLSREDDEVLMHKWIKIRANYEARSK